MRLARSDTGTGPAIVLLHGGGSGRGTWDTFTRDLTGWRVIAPDLRGHGESARCAEYPLDGFARDVEELLDELDDPAPVLVGHSLGAFTATLVAQRRPDRVGRLVLEDPPAPPRAGDRSGGFSRARLALTSLAGGLSRRRFDRNALMSAIHQLREPNPAWWDGLPKLQAPSLVLSGGPKSHIPPARLELVAAAIPGAELVTIPVGHRIHSTAPAEFSAAVLRFLSG
ncbi:alpha/beta hydrolase [Dactylosporangium vinaceum]|uniref:Alpha/beta fold hydrolase n=1 Tax=Dactylosporangium vinaceum TaxID=53362 RepID=A0ABV5MNR5_9ACTN|nr:alpha/beta hydrolase [Dactylosporangium vinaceum]UAB95639.1 alpha/beta hydrolase [Dactylosporangium vinaceum]